MSPRFLRLSEIEAIHEHMLRDHGGQTGVRNANGLASAAGMPEQSFDGDYLHAFPFEMAAAYAFHLAESQAFVDGNKRTGATAALVFLEINGWRTQPGDWLSQALMDVASGKLDKAGLTVVLEEHCTKA